MMTDCEIMAKEVSREKFNISLHPTGSRERNHRRLLRERAAEKA